MFDSPITTSHPIDSDIRLVEIGHGFDPANERLLFHAGLTCEIGPGFDPGHPPLLSHEWLDWEFGSPIEVSLTGISGVSDNTRQFLTTDGNDLTYEVLALLAEELNNPIRRYSRTPMRHRRAAQIKTDLMAICAPPKDLFIWGNSPITPPTQSPNDGPER